MNPYLLLIALLLSQAAIAGTADPDPFAADPFAADPFADEEATEPGIHRNRIELKGYYQDNQLRSDHPFNPGITLFNDDYRFIGLDASLESDWSSRWRTRARVYSRYLAGSADVDDGTPQGPQVTDRHDTHLLEGLLQWQSADQRLVIALGRSKPQWSNGYNYDIANLLQPQRNLPFIDQDNPLQSKGWDMLNAQYFSGSWSFAGYWVKSDSPDFFRNDSGDGSNKPNSEAVLRLGYQKAQEFSLLMHKFDSGKLAWGATFSTLMGDDTTFRAEWTQHPYRQLTLFDSNGSPLVESDERSRYQRFVVGSTYTSVAGWSLTGELFYNQHGANKRQWQQITEQADAAALRVRSGQSADFGLDFDRAIQGVDLMAHGWSRQRYASLMLMTAQSEALWQLRLSLQLSMDDDSRLQRIEILKSLNDHLSVRAELQLFNGCDLCEYGLNPSESNMRLVVSWLF